MKSALILSVKVDQLTAQNGNPLLSKNIAYVHVRSFRCFVFVLLMINVKMTMMLLLMMNDDEQNDDDESFPQGKEDVRLPV